MSNGCSGLSRGASGAVRRHRDRRRDRRDASRATPGTPHSAARVAFADLGGAPDATGPATAREFLGRNGDARRSRGARRATRRCRGRVGRRRSIPARALQTTIELDRGGSVEVVFLLGQAAIADEARDAGRALPRSRSRRAFVARSTGTGTASLGAVQVKTPDRAMDLLLNRWLLYQTLACRIWARSAFYQASGAYGFRDQLQDVHGARASRGPSWRASTSCAPPAGSSSRATCSTGGCPPAGQGVRTRISDDRVWLAYVVAHYVDVDRRRARSSTRRVPFLEGPPLEPGRARRLLPADGADERRRRSSSTARAPSTAASPLGAHGLPLMGTGDWNDGMNRVGEGGKGESVWLGWFLHAALDRLRAARRGARRRDARADAGARTPARCATALERDGWDGDWYRRAYLRRRHAARLGDQTTNAGSIRSRSPGRCSRAPPIRRAPRSAMAAVDAQLVRRDDRLALLFTPPFDKTPHDPGYIKGYPPGIRENGGQYTHAAIWVGHGASPTLGEGDKAAELFSHAQSDQPRAHTRADVAALQGRALRRRRRRLFASRRTSGAAAGPGTPARPAGCIAPASNRILGLRRQATHCSSTRAFRPPGRASR